jgi:hypothetical protein
MARHNSWIPRPYNRFMRSMPMRALRLPALFAVAFLFISCFETPVDEALQLRFLPNGAVVVSSIVQVSDGTGGSPALVRRLDEVRQSLAEGSDAWSRRFAAIQPAAERSSWEKQLGTLRKASHAAALTEPRDLSAFFGDTSVAVSYEIREGVAELVFAPGTAGRATRRQLQEMDRLLDDWTGSVARYLEAGEDLYRYLDDRPGRARACLGSLYADLLSESEQKALPELSTDEKEHVERLQEAMQEVLSVLQVPTDGDFTPDEISRLVYDPFPGRLTVRLPGPPLAQPEGFAAEGGALVVEGPSLWHTLRSLGGRWLAPDPVLLYVEAQRRTPQQPLDLATLARQPRRSTPAPGVGELTKVIENSLRPEPLYRVTWAVQPEKDDSSPFAWEPGEG